MTNELLLALDGSRWWARWHKVEPVATAVTDTILVHWVNRVEASIEENKQRNQEPSTFTTLAKMIGLSYIDYRRKASGKYQMTTKELLSICYVLQRSPADFFPTELELLAGTVRRLCQREIMLKECRAYSAYYIMCLTEGAPALVRNSMNLSLNSTIILAASKDPESGYAADAASFNKAIWDVAERIQPFLNRAQMNSHNQ